jgi:hypothetical protein
MIQDAQMRPNLGMQLPQFGFGNQGGIQGALQPLRGYISQQLQQKTNEEIGPFIEEVAGNAQETFDIEPGGGYNKMLYGGQFQPMWDLSRQQGGGLQSIFQNAQPALDQNNYNRAVPMKRGGTVGSGTKEQLDARRDAQASFRDRLEAERSEQNRNDADDRAAKQNQVDARREARKKTGIQSLMMNTPDPETGVTPNQKKNLLINQTSRFYDNPIDRPKAGFFSNLIKGSMPGQIFSGIFNQSGIMNDKLQQQGNYSADGGFGIGSFLNKITNTSPVNQVAIRDQMGKVIGVVGFNEKGTPVSHTGKLSGYMDAYESEGKGTVSQGQLVDFGQDNAFGLALGPNSGTSDDGPDDTPVSPTAPVTCPDGYIFDSETNACVAVEETVEETTEEEPIVVDPNVSVPTEYPLFNQGGVASLNDVARNMSRGPRGIAGYQGFMR